MDGFLHSGLFIWIYAVCCKGKIININYTIDCQILMASHIYMYNSSPGMSDFFDISLGRS